MAYAKLTMKFQEDVKVWNIQCICSEMIQTVAEVYGNLKRDGSTTSLNIETIKKRIKWRRIIDLASVTLL